MNARPYEFLSEAGRILNSGQSRSLILHGNITDVFIRRNKEGEADYVPLVELLLNQWSVKGNRMVIYELNGPIRFLDQESEKAMSQAWGMLYDDGVQQAIDLALARTKRRLEELQKSPNFSFKDRLRKAEGNPTYALELLRQMCVCSRLNHDGVPLLREDLLIIIEGADFLVPAGEISRMSDIDRQRIAICCDWFSDPGFVNGGDSVVLLSESVSLINEKIARLPQVMGIEVPAPDRERRRELIDWFARQRSKREKLNIASSADELAQMTAGLSSQALVQLLLLSEHLERPLESGDVVSRIESYIQNQLGDDVVEFKKPFHGMSDVMGFTRLKQFMTEELIPRIKSDGKGALTGAVVGGPIGAGKTFLLEAVAGELGIVVLVLKNLRSKWFGSTDVIFERLRRIVESIDKSLIFVDEADTQFGGVGADTHDTERRLTGKIQAMMSDPRLRGKTTWLLLTARIHLLSADLRRPGRAGSLMIPVLDPKGEDLDTFIGWMIKPVFRESGEPDGLTWNSAIDRLRSHVQGYYAAVFSEVRSNLVATMEIRGKDGLSIDEIIQILGDYLPPSLEKSRRYQELQALLNCTRLSLLPPEIKREEIQTVRRKWLLEIKALEAEGLA